MEGLLMRNVFSEQSTIGDVSLEGAFVCHSLEDRVRAPGVKVQDATCIPEGRYKVVVDWSPKHLAWHLHILDVPMFTGVRIHTGNSPEDTEGCVLLGMKVGPDVIQGGTSTPAWQTFCALVSPAIVADSFYITISHTGDIPPELLA